MFPACLRILLDGTTHYFDCPNDAWDWLEDYKCEHPKTGSPGGGLPGDLQSCRVASAMHAQGVLQETDTLTDGGESRSPSGSGGVTGESGLDSW